LFLDVTCIGTVAQAHLDRVLKNKPPKTNNKTTNLPLQRKKKKETKQTNKQTKTKKPNPIPYWDLFITLTG